MVLWATFTVSLKILAIFYVFILTFAVEVHNKQGSSHKVSAADCKKYLFALSADGGKCSGANNHDTKGGTWQVGDNGVSYHALGNEAPPKQDGLNKLYTGGVLDAQSANKGAGAPLNPWPFDSLNGVKPVQCHSHNDYDRNIPLFSAMSAGCIGIEADVFYRGGDVIIGHTSPTPGRTLRSQYVDPIRAILDHNNGGKPGPNGLYKAKPTQSIVLMVDFKTGDAGTLDATVKALQPLRDGGYLSRVENGKFVEKQVTVVLSGSSPFDRINSGDGIPNRDVFYDAKVDNWDSKYTSVNSYYASADFKSAVGNPGSAGSFSESQKNKVREQVGNAHSAGLKVRYCKFYTHPFIITTNITRGPAWRLHVGASGRLGRGQTQCRRHVRHCSSSSPLNICTHVNKSK